MGISSDIRSAGKVARILVSGQFDFRAQEGFKTTYQPHLEDPAIEDIEVDLSAVDYIDSTALGMLLILKENATPFTKRIAILNATGVALSVLKSAKFDQIFAFKTTA